MAKDKNEYFEKTMLEELVAGILSCFRQFFGWIALDVMVFVTVIILIVIGFLILIAGLPSEKEQKQLALETYHECRNVQELSEEACLLLALD